MGADASAYLFLGVDFDEVYKKGTDVKEYDLHDPKTGLKTGKKGQDKTEYYENIHTKERYENERYLLPTEDFTHNLQQESDDYLIGVTVKRINESNGGHEFVDPKDLEKARAEFEKKVRPFCGSIEPRLVLNLYWSY